MWNFLLAQIQNSNILHAKILIKEVIKPILSDTPYTAVKGNVFYLANSQVLCYEITFPEYEIWVIKDTNFWRFKKDGTQERKKTFAIVENSIFQQWATGDLSDFGLKNTKFFSPVRTFEQDSFVITEWAPKKGKRDFGKVAIAKLKDKGLLYCVVIYDQKGEIIARYFYEDYFNIASNPFPHTITQFIYIKKEKKDRIDTLIRSIKFMDVYVDSLVPLGIQRKLSEMRVIKNMDK